MYFKAKANVWPTHELAKNLSQNSLNNVSWALVGRFQNCPDIPGQCPSHDTRLYGRYHYINIVGGNFLCFGNFVQLKNSRQLFCSLRVSLFTESIVSICAEFYINVCNYSINFLCAIKKIISNKKSY